MQVDGEQEAFERALGALRRRERSVAEMAGWLEKRGYREDEIDGAVSRLVECGELDDERFSRLFAEDKRELAGWGSERIRGALRDRGLASSLIEAACAEDDHETQVERAVGLLVQRYAPFEDDRERNRALGMLNRRGYDYEVAHAAIRRHGAE